VVPAVVLFSLAVGIGLMAVPGREVLIQNLDVLSGALTQVSNFAVRLTPLGIFAIAASTAGTLGLEDLGRLQVYLITYVAVALLVTFWLLPGLVSVLTPFSYRDVVRASREAILTAFSTGSLIVVLPLIAERSKELLGRIEQSDEADNVIDVLVPIAFNFPTVGKLLTLSFVLFAAWFAGTRLELEQYPTFLVSGLLTFFGSTNVAIPFLLDLLRIPADMFQLFLAVGFVNFRFATLMSTMHTLALSLLATCAVLGALQLRWAPLLRYLLVSGLGLVAVLGGARLFFELAVDESYRGHELVIGRQMLLAPEPAVVHRSSPGPLPLPEPGRSRLDTIRERGLIRVGYSPQNMPLAYFGSSDELIGYDVEMAHQLARDIGVALEFVPTELKRLDQQLASGELDVATGIAVTPERAAGFVFSATSLETTLCMIVRDHRRHDFVSRESIAQLDRPRIGVPPGPYYRRKVEELFPGAQFETVNTVKEFFESEPGTYDAFTYVAEGAAAWTLIYPSYSVVVPQPDVVKIPFAYALPRGDSDFLAFINSWIVVKQADGVTARLYDYWVLGRDEETREPRWSVIRNVLGWVD
jgi:ABC-type amino acid transport substrate-binding protein